MKKNNIIFLSIVVIIVIFVILFVFKKCKKEGFCNHRKHCDKGPFQANPCDNKDLSLLDYVLCKQLLPKPCLLSRTQLPRGIVTTLTMSSMGYLGDGGYYVIYTMSSNIPGMSLFTYSNYSPGALQASYDATYNFSWPTTTITAFDLCSIDVPPYISMVGFTYGRNWYSPMWAQGNYNNSQVVVYDASAPSQWSMNPSNLWNNLLCPFYYLSGTPIHAYRKGPRESITSNDAPECPGAIGITFTVTAS